MKSAYELAMERLKAQDPEGAVSLTDQQRASLAEIDRKYKARFAEREIFLTKQLEEARLKGSYGEEEQILKQIGSEKELLNEEMNEAKEKIRRGETR